MLQITNFRGRMIFLVLLSSFLLYLSFPNIFHPFGFWLGGWFFAVPLFFALDDKQEHRTKFVCLGRKVFIGALFGIVFYAILIQWFLSYSVIGYIIFVAALSLQPLIFCLIYGLRRRNNILDSLYAAAAWVTSEYLRQFLMSGFSWDLGHSQSFNSYVIQSADIFGSKGISFVLILFNYCLYRLIRAKKKEDFVYGAAMVMISFLVWGYGKFWIDYQKTEHVPETFLIGAIQPNINYREKLDDSKISKIFQQQLNLTKQMLKKESHVSLIIWPETAIPKDFRKDASMDTQLKQLVDETKSDLLIGAALDEEDKLYNSAVLINKKGEYQNIYHKQYLVPFSEYVPQGKIGEWLADIMRIKQYDFTPGKEKGIFHLSESMVSMISYGVMICSEDTIGKLFRDYKKKNAAFVVVLLNDGWFKQNTARIMHAQNAIIHAVENRMPVIRVANTGWSGVIDKYGRVITGKDPESILGNGEQQLNKETFFISAVPITQEKTLYDFIGDTFCWISMAFVIMMTCIKPPELCE